MESNKKRTNIFRILKNSHILKRNEISRNDLVVPTQQDNKEFSNIEKVLSILRSKLIYPKNKIENQIKFLEFTLDNGSNNKDTLSAFYRSKLFLDIINAFNFSFPEYSEQLLSLIEKILSNKRLAKYISRNTYLFPKILEFCIRNLNDEVPIKISETLLMHFPTIYPIGSFIHVISRVYNHLISKDNLDIFCRVLAIFIFDYKKIKVKCIFQEIQPLRFNLSAKVQVQNQVISLHFAKILKNLMQKLNQTIKKIKEYSVSNNAETLLGILQNRINSNRLSNLEYNSENNDYHSSLGNQIEIEVTLKGRNKVVLTSDEFHSLIQLNIFSSFSPNFNSPSKNANSIFNIYHQLTKLMKTMKNKFKVRAEMKQYVSAQKILLNQIEILFVLSSFLGSKRNIDIQDKLGKLGIVESLHGYLDYIEWGNIFGDNARPIFYDPLVSNQEDFEYHGNGCCCDSDSTLKLQYLRVLYSFCNRDQSNIENKLKMFSRSDIENFLSNGYLELLIINIKGKYELFKKRKDFVYNKKFNYLFKKICGKNIKQAGESNRTMQAILNQMLSLDNINKMIKKYNQNDKQVGLIQKLVFKYIQECYYSSAKFWLSSCIEILLRGNNTFFQTFLANSGLMPCLLYDILYSHTEQKQIKQLSFDILGELIKFNRGNFYLLNLYLSDPKEFNEFFSIVLLRERLVDSNVFLRSIILSNFFFCQQDTKEGIPPSNFFTKKCKIFYPIESEIHKAFLSLVLIIKPDNIHQTNISCINTALLILITEYLKGNLINFLSEIRGKFKKEAREGFNNFRELITEWDNYYRYRSKDCASLEHSSTIPFNIWCKVVSFLLSKDPKEKMSLNFDY